MISSEFFIRHPRFSGVIACVLVLLGLMAIVVLPVSQYPQITPPQIIVSATYPGASADVLKDTVAVVIENELNGVEGMLYMSSTSNDNGEYKLTITFNIGVDPDIAQVKVENRLQQITAFLPPIVTQEGLSVSTQSANILGMLVLNSPNGTYDDLFLSNYAYTNIINPLKRVDGISTAQIYGPQYSIRVWLNPIKMASMNLVSDDVVKAIESQNIQAAVGTIGAAPSPKNTNQVLTLSAKGLLNTVEDFEEIIVVTDSAGGTVRLKDIATIEMGADNYGVVASFDNAPAVVIGMSQTPSSNSLQTMKNVKNLMAELQQTFPPDMQIEVAYDSTDFVRASIQSILSTLVITFCLVIGVVFLFLQNWRATLIPTITIPVSLIATFAVIYVFGFDINILTLFALILAIGLVVDDAIIVVERVQYLMKYKNMNSTDAAVQAIKDIGGAIVATTLVLLSIFIPVGLMAGITGKIYQQFAVTIATAVVFSAINALTLSPALCAIFLRKKSALANEKQGFFFRFNEAVDYTRDKYLKGVGFLAGRLLLTLGLVGATCLLIAFMFYKTPTSFIPQEDEGVIFGNLQLPETASINQTNELLYSMGEGIMKMPGVQFYIGIAGASLLGSGGENIGMAVIGLQNWSKRTAKSLSLESIMDKLRGLYMDNPIASVNFYALPSIPGVGSADGLSFQLNAINPSISADVLAHVVDAFLEKMNHMPEFAYAFTTFTAGTPHVFLDINRVKLESLKIPVSAFFNALQNNLGSRYVNNITLEGQVNKVIVQADFNYRKSLENVENMYIRSNAGQMVQVKEFADMRTVMMPKIIYRYNQYLSAAVTAQTANSVSTGEAIKTLKRMVNSLGKDYGIAWTGLSLQEVETSGLAFILIGLALIFSYLFLVALYESWLVAFSVILSNIFAVLGALVGLMLLGLPLSIYAQLGLVLLIGLASKNAILIVEFILDFRNQGQSIFQAAVNGASERYRAVVMTALTFILGVMPMVFDKGAGAASQNSMGTAVFFGMIFATTIGIMFVPGIFGLFDTVAVKFSKSNEDENNSSDENKPDTTKGQSFAPLSSPKNGHTPASHSSESNTRGNTKQLSARVHKPTKSVLVKKQGRGTKKGGRK